MSACTGHCPDCSYEFCVAAGITAEGPGRPRARRGWRREARAELEDLAELYGLDAGWVRL